MKHKEVLPIGILTVVGFTCEVLWTIRLAFTRDDVVFLNKKMACEQVETRVGPMYSAPVRKFRVYHQKYEVPTGLLQAIQTPAEEEQAGGGGESKK
ncbi:yellow-emperor [Cochliomyia hominivorax]